MKYILNINVTLVCLTHFKCCINLCDKFENFKLIFSASAASAWLAWSIIIVLAMDQKNWFKKSYGDAESIPQVNWLNVLGWMEFGPFWSV